MIHLDSDVLVIGAGGAGMYAALAAARTGARVLLVDRALIGRGGATVMAQMTVAAAMGEACPDHWTHHLADTLAAGRGLCDPALAQLLCERGPERIREMDAWKTGWARRDGGSGPMSQVMAPGHDRARCVYVDFLNTGPAVSKALRVQLNRIDAVRRIGDVMVTDLVEDDGEVIGAAGMHLSTGEALTISAGATIVATGGLTRLYRRNSASANMAGDGYALALRAGATLVDMEFVQFFPIGHLAPRLIGMDPIMWDPFRYKLGGRLTNAAGEEIGNQDGQAESGRYVLTRDVATWAIIKEVEAGRGSPAGGAWLSFRHLPDAQLRAAFGPVIDRLAKNGIDLTKQDVEVAPIAHYHMGGVRVNTRMETDVAGLYAAGEAVGGANGANRLSGNAITEALVFGERAGESAARHVLRTGGRRWRRSAADAALARVAGAAPARLNTAATIAALQDTMTDDVGPFRTDAKLRRALEAIHAMSCAIGDQPPASEVPYGMERLDWFDLRNMLMVARVVAESALERRESRGAHQREDHPGMLPEWQLNQTVRWRDGAPEIRSIPVPAAATVQGEAA
jgi:succinate dehydrogenase/fumarate reductase flavoprotein subunit